MILISFSLALIAIVYGAKLLAQSQKEALGALYKYLAWFVMLMGFLVLLCDGAHGVLRMHRMRENRMMDRECMMMNEGGDCMMGGGPMMMHCDRDGMGHENCCSDGMMNGGDHNNCSMHGDGGNCPEGGNMNCKDGSCKDGGMGTSCPMDKMKCCNKDSAKAKK